MTAGKSAFKFDGMFVFHTFIEIFETLLTYATNTLSFVRVGAFAISHAGLMHVVLQLSQAASGSHNILILILGNLLVVGIEGLLVGIQSLRLGFYEMFSRFFKGSGRAFAPHKVE
jgi:V/A-type H+-transporting ATPase subunit I